MLTRCPSCEAWFRVRAEHLSVANGFVTCGACEQVFNALSTLVEETAPPPVLTAREAPPQVPSPSAGPSTEQQAETPVAPPSTPDSYDGSAAFVSEEPAPAAAQATTRTVSGSRVEDEVTASAVIHTASPDDSSTRFDSSPEQDTPAEPEPLDEPAPDSIATPDPESQQQTQPLLGTWDERDNDVASLLDQFADDDETATSDSAPADEPPVGDEPSPEPLDAGPIEPAEADASSHDEPEPVSFEPPHGKQLSAAEHAVLFEAPEHDEHPARDTTDAFESADRQAVPDSSAETAVIPGETQGAGIEPAPDETDADTNLANEAVPDVLRDEYAALEQARDPRPRRRLGWLLAAAVLAAVIVVQLLLVNRDVIEARYPATMSWFERACSHLPCEARAKAQTATVHLLARDIRDHPQYLDALLVNATLVNEAATALPFPELQLTLHDATGTIIGTRRFAPDEYLDDSIPVAPGMPPGQPVYVVMELGGAASSAVSFEFTFL